MSRASLALALAAAATSATAGEPQSIRRHFEPKDYYTGRYQYLPFDVPPGTTRIDIEYRYDKANGANVADLGLYEPGPLELQTPALRGWTGGERDKIFVAVDAATPGYWPGPLPDGRWNVQLGLYRVGPAGFDVEVLFTTSSGPVLSPPAIAERSRDALKRGPAWYSGALHAHTVHSDGSLTPQELAQEARAAGLDFLVITDHNNTVHQLDRVDVPGLLVVSGEEVTTPGGHASVWGLHGPREYVDFRVLPGDPRIEDLVKLAHAKGALFSINHPFVECFACAWTHSVPEGVDGIEIANRDARTLAQSIAMWDTLLRQGRRLVAVGSSDFHRRGEVPIGTASVRVLADALEEGALLRAIQAGRVVVMADARNAPPLLSVRSGRSVARVGDTLRVKPGAPLEVEVSIAGDAYAGGRIELVWRGEPVARAAVDGASVRFTRLANAGGYLRVHVYAANGAPLAVTNPVFVEVDDR
jgi:predicted metal-dependent phosphoesterase TrpH